MSVREAVDLALTAASDPATYLGAELAGLTAPASHADLALMAGLTRLVGEKMRAFIPLNETPTEPAGPQASESELAAAEQALEQSIIFH